MPYCKEPDMTSPATQLAVQERQRNIDGSSVTFTGNNGHLTDQKVSLKDQLFATGDLPLAYDHNGYSLRKW